jgi:hypothetical protein
MFRPHGRRGVRSVLLNLKRGCVIVRPAHWEWSCRGFGGFGHGSNVVGRAFLRSV